MKKAQIEMADSSQPWRLWGFVIGLNIVGVIGVIYLRSKGIDLYAFRGSS